MYEHTGKMIISIYGRTRFCQSPFWAAALMRNFLIHDVWTKRVMKNLHTCKFIDDRQEGWINTMAKKASKAIFILLCVFEFFVHA
jgi:hypothetical protein